MTTDSLLIQLEGGRPLYETETRAAILDVLMSSPFAVERYTFADEQGFSPLDRDDVLRPLRSSGLTLFLRRDSSPVCEMSLSLSDRVSFLFRVEAQALVDVTRDAVLSLADRIAAAVEPDMGWVHVHRRLDPPFVDAAVRARALLDAGTYGGPLFRDRGPGGLGMRTYFGGRALQVLPAALLFELPPPAIATRTSWGGVRVDLCSGPLDADDGTVLAAAASAHRALAAAKFFGEPSVTERSVDFESPPWWRREALGLAHASRPAEPTPRAQGREALLAAIAGGVTISDRDMASLSAPAAKLDGLRAERVVLSRCDLAGASLQAAVLADVDLDGARLAAASFVGAQLDQVELRGAICTGTRFDNAELVNCFGQSMDANEATFRSARLEYPDFAGAKLTGACFDRASLDGAFLGEASLDGATFVDATLERCDFGGCDLTDADFSGARLVACTFAGATLKGARWDRTSLQECVFDEGAPTG